MSFFGVDHKAATTIGLLVTCGCICVVFVVQCPMAGVVPFWAFLERVERVPMSTAAGSRPGLRERRLSSVRNTVGAVASLGNATTPLGRARAWIRQCLGCKCLEACVAAMLQEDRLVKVTLILSLPLTLLIVTLVRYDSSLAR